MDWTPLHARVHQTLRTPPPPLVAGTLLPRGSSLLVAVSGGQDSLCLLRLLVDLRDKWGWTLRVLYGDHCWRDDSAENGAFVQQLAADWGVPCDVVTAKTPPASEAAARTWRYGELGQAAVAHGCTHVVTGHTASDRAETLLYNLMRGSGADGLQALTWQRPLSADYPQLTLVRPLLRVTRQETGQFCQARHMPVWVDRTNEDRTYARNRIRLDLLPQLQTFNPQVETNLAQTAEMLSAEVAYLEAECDRLESTCLQWHPPQLHRPALQPLPLALQRRLVRRFLTALLPRQSTFDQVEKVVALITAPNRSQTDPFPGGAIARVEGTLIRWLEPLV
jgi:tRNA(Ile)-lysidine synthase